MCLVYSTLRRSDACHLLLKRRPNQENDAMFDEIGSEDALAEDSYVSKDNTLEKMSEEINEEIVPAGESPAEEDETMDRMDSTLARSGKLKT